MKKNLVTLLALVFVLSIAGTAFAAPANPFVDVPAKHWAYDAVSSLAKAGIVDGYGDGTFRGDRTMTRYEMAQIVGKAMAKSDKADAANKALIDKLAVEFASELNNMGVRLAKVEAKQNVWVGGESRFRYYTNNPLPGNAKSAGNNSYDFRQRIKFWGTVNDDVSYMSRIATQSGGQRFGEASGAAGNTGWSNIVLDIGNVTVKHFMGLDSIRVGRSAFDFFTGGIMGKPHGWDGVTINQKFGDVQFTGFIGAGSREAADGPSAGGFSSAQVGFNLADNWNQKIGYFWNDTMGTNAMMNTFAATNAYQRSKGWTVASKVKLGDFTLLGEYAATSLVNAVNVPTGPKAFSFMISNGKKAFIYPQVAPVVDMSKTGDQGFALVYHSADPGALPYQAGGWDAATPSLNPGPANWYSLSTNGTNNLKSWWFTYQFVLAKNTLLSFDYADFKFKNTALANNITGSVDKVYIARVEFFF